MEDRWLSWAKRLQAISSTGQFFGASDFDKERYDEIFKIANGMLASLGNVPMQQIAGLVPDAGEGYATPRVDVRGAIFRNQRILLVQEKLDGLWTLPGGYADVGASPAENIEKEVLEEANIAVKAVKLFGVFHKSRHEYQQDARDFYKLFFICEPLDDSEPEPGAETQATGYFELSKLPPLSKGRVIEKHIRLAYDYLDTPNLATVFD
ncbi:MAG: NUDIX hydrolase [bacterium]|nr:NUDIX domain-containing protein [Gammaproteobacteria bacterium]HIL98378.1 NUDIX domain-containing protein [Pseudomonadales bacterium]